MEPMANALQVSSAAKGASNPLGDYPNPFGNLRLIPACSIGLSSKDNEF